MKKTPLYEKHKEYNGSIVDFAGFKMPMQFSSIFDEVKTVRNAVGLFDVSHMGEIEISGKDALDFLNYIITNDAENLDDFKALYTTMLYRDGGIVNDLIVYKLPDKYLLVVNAANREKDYKWILENKKRKVKIENKSDEYFQLAVQGPNTESIMEKVWGPEVKEIKFYRSELFKFNGDDVIISRTGYTGEDGFEIYGPGKYGTKIWDKLMEAGAEKGIKPCGLGARDLLRLEMGYCLYGNDITKNTTPLEANLSWVVKMDKEDFIGKDALEKQKKEGVKRKLVGIEVPGRNIPRHGYKITKEGNEIGEITSGNYSPILEHSISLGYVEKEFSDEGTELEIEIRNRKVKGKIIKLPFWKKGSLKR